MIFANRLNQRLGEAVRNQVVRDIGTGAFQGSDHVGTLTRILALAILGTPYVVGALGIALIGFGFPSIAALLIGGILLGAAFYLLPGRARNSRDTIRRPDAPVLFELLDKISHEIGAPEIAGVHVTDDFNAYLAEFPGGEAVVGLGAPFWISLDPEERLAVLAHEVAHLANNDPARSRVTGAALDCIRRWFELFAPPALIDRETNSALIADDRTLTGQLVAAIFGAVTRPFALGYEKLIFRESQRAEYLADLLATRVAGKTASQSALKKVILSPLAEDRLADLYYDGSKPVHAFAEMAEAVRIPDPDVSARLYQHAVSEFHTIDSSHPPTRFRLEVIGLSSEEAGAISAADVDWSAIDRELSAAFAVAEKKLLGSILVQ